MKYDHNYADVLLKTSLRSLNTLFWASCPSYRTLVDNIQNSVIPAHKYINVAQFNGACKMNKWPYCEKYDYAFPKSYLLPVALQYSLEIAYIIYIGITGDFMCYRSWEGKYWCYDVIFRSCVISKRITSLLFLPKSLLLYSVFFLMSSDLFGGWLK